MVEFDETEQTLRFLQCVSSNSTKKMTPLVAKPAPLRHAITLRQRANWILSMLRDTPPRLICCAANAVCNWLLWGALLKTGSTYLYQLGILEQSGVNVELSHVIDDDSTSKTLSVGKQVAQQRGLAGPKEAADERHGQLSLACEVRSCGQYCACSSANDFCVETYQLAADLSIVVEVVFLQDTRMF